MSDRRSDDPRQPDGIELLVPRLVGREPELVSDGAGLAFPPSALTRAAPALDPCDPAVHALLSQIRGQRPGLRLPWRRGRGRAAALDPGAAADLAGWRQLARSQDEALFGRGRPPQLLTVAVRRDSRAGTWTTIGVTRDRPLRAARPEVRASSWRVAPGFEPAPADTELRLLVTEQRRAAGRYAHGRFLEPDLHLGTDEVVLTIFVAPLHVVGVQGPNPETPVRIALPEPLGERGLRDGALYG